MEPITILKTEEKEYKTKEIVEKSDRKFIATLEEIDARELGILLKRKCPFASVRASYDLEYYAFLKTLDDISGSNLISMIYYATDGSENCRVFFHKKIDFGVDLTMASGLEDCAFALPIMGIEFLLNNGELDYVKTCQPFSTNDNGANICIAYKGEPFLKRIFKYHTPFKLAIPYVHQNVRDDKLSDISNNICKKLEVNLDSLKEHAKDLGKYL